jgi:hypothetical protein
MTRIMGAGELSDFGHALVDGTRAVRAVTLPLTGRNALAARAALTASVTHGFAGALGPGVPILGWVTAARLYRLEAGRAVEVPVPPGLLRPLPEAIACAVLSADAVLAGGSALLPAPAAVAAAVPFAVHRLVTDTPAAPLAHAARAAGVAMKARGIAKLLGAARVAAAAVTRPAETPRLVRRARGGGGRWRRGGGGGRCAP